MSEVPSPFRAFRDAAQALEQRLLKWRKAPILGRMLPQEGHPTYWRLLASLDRRFPSLTGLQSHPEVVAFRNALADCRVYYHVGMSGLNEFWEHGLIYKRWVLEQTRQRVELVVLSAQGLGPTTRVSARRELRALLAQADVVSLRDKSYGAALLAELGLRQVKSRVVFDEAFSLPVASEETTGEWLVRAGIHPEDAFIAFHYRETDYTGPVNDPVAKIGRIIRLVHEAIGLKFLFVPMSYARHSCIDVELGRRLAVHLGSPRWFYVLPECRDVRVVKSVIGRARFSMGMSYHAHVFSLSQGHPALILYTGDYYALKSEGLVAFYGLPSRVLDLEKTDHPQILGAVMDIASNYDEACRTIGQVNRVLQRDNDWTLEEIRRCLGLDGGPSQHPPA